MAVSLFVLPASAQLSTNPDKFLGNITTSYNHDVDTHGFIFANYWNQITPENCTKWDAIEPSRGNFSFGNPDKSANYAKQHHFPFKYHTLIWGAQYPSWMNNLSTAEQYRAIVEYFDEVKKHYPNLEIIDVVNEAITGHQPAPYKAALGGNGRTGYDWIVKAFQLAHERWPNAILVYNDYNSFTWQRSQFISLVRTLRDAGAPIDAYGHQSHDLTDISLSNFKSYMNEIHTALQMPMYSTEFDIGTSDDQKQKTQYKNLIPVLWESDYCAGITLWGWIYGNTWTTDGNSGLIRNGEERPALTWLREYMQSDAAKNAKSPFPGFKKEASVYVKPASMKVVMDDVLQVLVDATLATKTIEKVDLYMGLTLIDTKTEAPYIFEVSSSSTGTKTLKAVVTATDGSKYERLSRITVQSGTTKREPYNEIVPSLPCTLHAGEFDKGLSGISYSNVTRSTSDTSAPIKTNSNSWMEYTVDVAEDGFYSFDMEVASEQDGGLFHLVDNRFGDMIFLTDFIEVPNTGSTTDFQTVSCKFKEYLTAGRHVFCLNVDKGGFYVKSLTFKLIPTFSMPGTVVVRDLVRSEGVEIKTTAEGNVLTMDNADWTEYLVDVTLNNNKYSYELAASSVTGASVSMTLIDSDGNEKSLGTVSVPNTGSLDTYQVKKGKIRNTLNEGKQTLRITMKSGSCNIASLNFTNTEATGIDELEDNDAAITGDTYNLSGQKVDAAYRGIVIRNGKKMIKK